jgi:methylmalonyl-CoA mutase, N-terminal domain
VRAERNAAEAATALAEVRRVAEGGDGNLLPPMRKALHARVTVGEICNELRDVFGTYDSQRTPN